MLKKIKIIYPAWNCGKCNAERQKWLTDLCLKNIVNKDTVLVFIGGEDNPKKFNEKFKYECNEILEYIRNMK